MNREEALRLVRDKVDNENMVKHMLGLVTAAALIRPEKRLELVEPKSLKKRFKEPSFAKGARKEDIMTCSASENPDSSVSPRAPILLTTVFDPVEAEIIVGKLRSAGIEAFARHEALSVVFGLTVDGCGQQDIMVPEEDLAEARAALETGS